MLNMFYLCISYHIFLFQKIETETEKTKKKNKTVTKKYRITHENYYYNFLRKQISIIFV